MDTKFEDIVPWNGANDTGRDVRLKWKRNFGRIADALQELSDADKQIIKDILKEIDKIFLHKDKADTAQELITFLKGLLIGKNGSGITVLENGMSQAVVDYLYVKVKAVFDELEVKRKLS